MRDVTTVNELVTAYKSQPGEVAAWLREGEPEITRSAVKLLRAFLGEKFGQEEPPAIEEGSAGPALQELPPNGCRLPATRPPPLALWRRPGAAPAARGRPVARAPSRRGGAGMDTP